MRMLLGALLAAIWLEAAAEYPTKPIRAVVPFGAGSSTDIVVRIIAQPLGQGLGQSVVIEDVRENIARQAFAPRGSSPEEPSLLTRWQHRLQSVQRAGHAAAPLVQDVRVDHRRRDIRVPEQFLHRADVVTRREEMSCETMSKHVW